MADLEKYRDFIQDKIFLDEDGHGFTCQAEEFRN